MKRLFTDEQAVSKILDTSLTSVSSVLRALGADPVSGSSHIMVKRIAAEHKLSTQHWTGQGWAKGIHDPRKSDTDYFCVRRARVSGDVLLRNLLKRGLRKRVCESCNGTRWLGKLIPLEVHHINGNPKDNRIQNLQVLCCNCHAQTPNFGSKNRH